MVGMILGLSLAFQAQFLAGAQPRDERIGAANARDSPWTYGPPRRMKMGARWREPGQAE